MNEQRLIKGVCRLNGFMNLEREIISPCVLRLPALVGPFRGEFVAAAAVWGVAKGSI